MTERRDMNRLLKACSVIDSISTGVSNTVCLLFLPMTLISVYEVAMRYLFNSPTTWAWDVNVQLFCLLVVFGSASALLNRGHVIMDILVAQFSANVQAVLRVFVYLVFIFALGIVTWQTAIFAWRSILIHERTSSLLAAPVFPLKIGIFLGVALLWVQGICLWLRDVHQIGGNWKRKGIE
jgi:TRAP-type mannitol/chloroaromatic compound transport system permease small subunit